MKFTPGTPVEALRQTAARRDALSGAPPQLCPPVRPRVSPSGQRLRPGAARKLRSAPTAGKSPAPAARAQLWEGICSRKCCGRTGKEFVLLPAFRLGTGGSWRREIFALVWSRWFKTAAWGRGKRRGAVVPLSPWSSETKLASCDSPPSLVCGIASSGCERVPLFAGGVLSEKGLLQRKRHQRGSFQTPRHSKPRDLKTSPSSKETNFASNFPDVSLSESPTGKPRDLCPRDAERPPAPGGSGRHSRRCLAPEPRWVPSEEGERGCREPDRRGKRDCFGWFLGRPRAGCAGFPRRFSPAGEVCAPGSA